MSKLPRVSGQEVALARAGFEQVSQKGSHVKVRNDAGRSAIIQMRDEVAPGTLSSILRQAGLTREDFRKLLS